MFNESNQEEERRVLDVLLVAERNGEVKDKGIEEVVEVVHVKSFVW